LVLNRIFRNFVAWGYRRRGFISRRRMTTFEGQLSAIRVEFLWNDEWIQGDKRWNRPPWWRPFNAFLHCWKPEHNGETFHDHPRWSITVCLAGQLIERTPWSERTLKPGSVVIRSRKAIHAFYVPPKYRGRTWTLFVVGRRNHRQNRYVIEGQTLNSSTNR
jgi:hypothetical protein